MGQIESSQNHSDSTWATYLESMTSRNYRQQPYLPLNTYFRKYEYKSSKPLPLETALGVS